MSRRRFDSELRDAREPKWLERLEEASYAGKLTQDDGKELLDAVQYLRRELALTREAFDRVTRPEREEAIVPPLGDHLVEWLTGKGSRISRLCSVLGMGSVSEAREAAAELSRIPWPMLGVMYPEMRKMAERQVMWEGATLKGWPLSVEEARAVAQRCGLEVTGEEKA